MGVVGGDCESGLTLNACRTRAGTSHCQSLSVIRVFPGRGKSPLLGTVGEVGGAFIVCSWLLGGGPRARESLDMHQGFGSWRY